MLSLVLCHKFFLCIILIVFVFVRYGLAHPLRFSRFVVTISCWTITVQEGCKDRNHVTGASGHTERNAAMLVLTRKKSELIQIGNDVVIKVIHMGKNSVKIGIDAPNGVRVLRGELCEPLEEGHPLAEFLKERTQIRTGGCSGRIEKNRLTSVAMKPR